ncbi:hypothetical protein J40TS1_10500 [Paenibacillus montaniterrae]|uniref:Capsule synthesis protein CapA domain-containing protein n=1 Tax=Paenibacillus montaniterrae TaxID=429341 RepID=A0A919YR36_9BACL|nr:CapA family protein [Paenibacillus montaniterrae]GIP15408.1 hypothetical protein J40TS1_10500 [Paenibacillus montaniterrae]
MSLSRVESRKRQQENKQKRKNRRKKFVVVQLCLIALILLGLGLILQADRLNIWVDQVSGMLKGEQRVIHNVPDTGTDNGLQADDAEPEPSQQPNDEQETGAGADTDPQEDSEQAAEPPATDGEGQVDEDVPPPATAEPSESQTVQLAFVGDLLLGEYIQSYLDSEGASYPYQQALFHLTSADITAGNLEMPITKVDEPAENKTYVFKGAPEALNGLVDAGFDVVSLANNHTLDHGVNGLLDTMKYLDEYGIHHVGAGNNAEEAYAPYIQEVNGIKVAYVATSRVLPETTWKANRYSAGLAESYDPTQTLDSIAELEETAHITVVLVHWGKERADSPDENQLNLAKKYIDAGADLVIGSHPHVLQGFEQYKGKWIAYSLGNFVFSSHPKGRQAETGVLTATCNHEADCELQFAPMKINNAQPTPVEGADAVNILQFLEQVSLGGVRIDERGNISS